LASATSRISAQAPAQKPQAAAASNAAANAKASDEPSVFSQLMADVAAAKPAEARTGKPDAKKEGDATTAPPPGKTAETAPATAQNTPVQPQDDGETAAPVPQPLVPLLNPDLAATETPAAAPKGADKDSIDGDSDVPPPASDTAPDVTPDMTAALALMMPPPPAQPAPPVTAPVLPQDGDTVDDMEDTAPIAALPRMPDMPSTDKPDTAPRTDAAQAAETQTPAPQDIAKTDVTQSETPPVTVQQATTAQPAMQQAAPKEADTQAAPEDTKEAEAVTAAVLPQTAKPLPPKAAAKTAMANPDAANPTIAPHGHSTDTKIDQAGETPRAAQADAAPVTPPPAPPQPANSQPPAPMVGPLVVTIAEPTATAAKSAGIEKAAPSDGPQPNMDVLAVQIAAKSQSGAKQFDIRLDPPELGRVDVRLSIDSSGKAQAHLTADQPQTLELLQKDASSLTRALRDAGLDVSQNGLNFSLRGQNGNQADTGMGGRSGRRTGIPVDTLKRLDPGNLAAAQWRGPTDGRLDIRV
jgi:flagellar hook-length control protein FliK